MNVPRSIGVVFRQYSKLTSATATLTAMTAGGGKLNLSCAGFTIDIAPRQSGTINRWESGRARARAISLHLLWGTLRADLLYQHDKLPGIWIRSLASRSQFSQPVHRSNFRLKLVILGKSQLLISSSSFSASVASRLHISHARPLTLCLS